MNLKSSYLLLNNMKLLTVVALSECNIALPISCAPNSKLCIVKTIRALVRPQCMYCSLNNQATGALDQSWQWIISCRRQNIIKNVTICRNDTHCTCMYREKQNKHLRSNLLPKQSLIRFFFIQNKEVSFSTYLLHTNTN